MKTPRLDDFAQTPTRPIRELHSPLDGMPRIEKRPRHHPDTPPPPDDVAASPDGQAVASSPDRIPTTKRFVVRRGFDYYEDQLAALKKLSLREQLAGRDGSMSRMMRDALDDYLAKHSLDPDLT